MAEAIAPQKSIFRRFWWVGIIIIILVVYLLKVLGRGPHSTNGPDTSPTEITATEPKTTKPDISQASINSDEGWPSKDAKYITAVPLDLTQIESMSKYRSCSGHDNSGYSFEKILETKRSMKHYVYPVPAYQGTLDKVKMFAPFDGTVSKIDAESDQIGQPGKRPRTGNGITFSTLVDKNVGFLFGHIYFTRDFKVGDTIKAGELVGYAALGDKGNDFDIALEGRVWTDDKQPILGSAFDHMTDSVLAEFAKYGITPDNTKVTKEYRDSHPCDYTSGTSAQGRGSADWVTLKN